MNSLFKNQPVLDACGTTDANEEAIIEGQLRSQRGIGALEWIAIIAVVLFMLYQIIGRVSVMNTSNSTLGETSSVSALHTALRSNLKSGTGYAANGADLIVPLYNAKGIPTNLSYNGGVLLNTYGSQYTIVAANAGFGFAITDPGVPAADCIKLVIQQSQSGNWTGGISVGGSNLGNAPVTTANAQTACNGATNSIVFTSNS
ncbi:type IV B pilus protein (plasmid) [Burkholderia vietnamiensis]|uniref:Type IV B pilus protein n=1 Tax=Burkholderia vietnamiensis (strain G4 / LMG 22486) TaxID=269482 RepID=A4JVG9_BURVG|nr:type IV B pilus protein [Burkholderia vietnamiensis G4]MCB4349460.1 type IV B pilus protein [Burkholderia vietnamiensis]